MNNDQILIAEYNALREKHIQHAALQTKCPICGSEDLHKAFRDIVRLKNAEVYALSEDWFISCNTCGLIMKEILYPDAYYNEYLNKFYTVDAVKIEPYSYSKANTRLNILFSLQKPFKNILEVSSFDGVTLSLLQDKYAATVVGIEPTSSAVKTSVREFPSLENKIVNDVFEKALEYPLTHATFDLVLFSHCFRHFNDPLKALDILNQITKEGSIVLIDEGACLETLFISATKEQIQREMFQQKAFYYSKHNLEYLLSKFGFKLIHTLYTDLNHVRYTGFVFEKIVHTLPNKNSLEISKNISNSFLNLMKKFYYSTEDIIKTLKKYG